MRKSLSILFIILFFIPLFSENNNWSKLKLIYYYDSQGMRNEVIDNLSLMKLNSLFGKEKKKIINNLISFADLKVKTDKELSKKVYLKILNEVPDYWYMKNKLVNLEKSDGSLFYDFKVALSQFLNIRIDFSSSFLMLNIFVNSFLYSVLLVVFIFSIIALIRYFFLFTNDVLIDNSGFSFKNAIILTVFFIWPVVFLSGWIAYPVLVLGILFKYMSNSEKNTVYLLLSVSIIALFAYSFTSVLTEHFSSESFKIDRRLYEGVYSEENYSNLTDEQKIVYSYSEYKKKNYIKAREILSFVNDERYSQLKLLLLGNLFFKKFKSSEDTEDYDLSKSMRYYSKVLRKDENNEIALNNLALVLFRDISKENSKKVFESYEKRYPRLNDKKNDVLKLEDPTLDGNYLWRQLIKFSDVSFNPARLISNVFVRFFSIPFIYYILVFFMYIKFLKRIFPSIGESTKCSKCSKIIKKKNIHKSYNLCEDCNQLFLIKDVIFLEAKLLKEKEIKKKNFISFIKIMLASVFIPGLNLNFKNRSKTYFILSVFLFFFLIFAFTGFMNFKALNLPIPFVFNISGIIAAVLYFVINIFSVSGEDYGV